MMINVRPHTNFGGKQRHCTAHPPAYSGLKGYLNGDVVGAGLQPHFFILK